MDHQWVLWILLLANIIHLIEERFLGWIPWASRYLGCRRGWKDFDFLVLFFLPIAFTAASLGWSFPILPLGIAFFGGVEALVFHVFLSIHGREFSPGVLSGVGIYLPAIFAAFWAAYADGVLSAGVLFGAAGLGIFILGSLAYYIRHPTEKPWKIW